MHKKSGIPDAIFRTGIPKNLAGFAYRKTWARGSTRIYRLVQTSGECTRLIQCTI